MSKESGKTKWILISSILGILAIAGVGAWMYWPVFRLWMGGAPSAKTVASEESAHKELIFITLPEMLINLRSSDHRSVFLKAVFVVECSSVKEGEEIEKIKPMLVDQYQTYLRELTLEDLKGSEGIERVRQELLRRTRALTPAYSIDNILFKEFIIQ